jgi:hypothetical protein
MIIMVYMPMYDMYIPIFHILLSGKSELVYYEALQGVISASGWTLEAGFYTCDFEVALINACKSQFREVDGSKFKGCVFHWKQACRRKLLQLGIPADVVTLYIGKDGFMDVLTVIDPAEMLTKGE